MTQFRQRVFGKNSQTIETEAETREGKKNKPSAAMAKTERPLLRVCMAEPASLAAFALRRIFPKKWEREEEVKEDEGRERRPRKARGERSVAGIL